MSTNELSKDLRNRVVERHRSGDGCKNISKALNIPWSTVKTIIKKWKAYSTTKTLPRSGSPSKLDDQARSDQRATGLYNRVVTVCMWQYPKHSTSLACTVGWQEGRHYSKKPTIRPVWGLQKNTLEILKSYGKKFCGLMKPKWNFLA